MRNICVLAALILIGVMVLTAGIAAPAFGQSLDCRGAAVDQYEECDEDTVTVVPRPDRPDPDRPDPDRPGPEQPRPDGGGSVITEVDPDPDVGDGKGEVEVPDAKILAFEKGSSSAPASGTAPGTAPGAAPGDASVSSSAASSAASVGSATEVAQGDVLPDTGGMTPLVPVVGGALLLGAGVLSGRRIVRKR